MLDLYEGVDLYPYCLAADPATSRVYIRKGYTTELLIFRWDGLDLIPDGALCDAGEIFAVVPPVGADGARLIAGRSRGRTLRVYSLPDHTLIGMHELPEGSRLNGIASDPSGAAIAIVDIDYGGIHVVAWPIEPLTRP